jgi:hypothetical protein
MLGTSLGTGRQRWGDAALRCVAPECSAATDCEPLGPTWLRICVVRTNFGDNMRRAAQ